MEQTITDMIVEIRREYGRYDTPLEMLSEIASKAVQFSLESREQEMEALRAENKRLADEWQQCHEWNNKLVAEHYSLRNDVLEEAAKVAERECKQYAECAEAIRSLKEPKP